MAAAVDTGFIASYCSIPQANVESLINTPTTDLITSFLRTLTSKAQEHEALKAQRMRADIELENAVRGGEAKARALKTNADKALEEVETLRKRLDEAESSRTSLHNELDSLRSSTSTSASESESLRSKVQRLETSKREAMALVDSKTTAHDKLADDLSQSQLKVVALRREITSLEEKQQQADNFLNNAKFKESSLQQELAMLKRNNDWLDGELKNKTGEFSKFRKDKNLRISELQRVNEEANTNISSLQRTEATLRNRIDEASRKSEEHLTKIQRLQDEALRAEEGFRAELDSARRLAQLHEQSAQNAKHRVEELDEEVEKSRQDAADEVSNIQSELETEREAREAAEAKTEELEAQVERLEANPPRAMAGSPSIPGSPRPRVDGLGAFGTPLRGSSPAVGTPGSRARGNLSLTQLYSELNRTKSELEDERRRSAKFSSTIEEIMSDLENKAPEIQDLQENNARLESDVADLTTSLNQAQQDRDVTRKEGRKWESQAQGLKREADLLRQQLRDLSTQIKVLSVEVQIRSEGVQLSTEERQAMQRAATGETDEQIFEGMTDTGRFISQRLATFRSVFELQEQNSKLLNLVRELGEQMEGDEAKAKQNQQERDQAELLDLRDRVEQLKDQLDTMRLQSESFVKERDVYRRMLSHRGQIPRDVDLESMFGETMNGIATPSRNGMNGSPPAPDYAQESRLVKEIQTHFDAYKREAATDHETLREQINNLAKDKSSLQGEMARANSQVSMAQERYEMLQSNYNMLKTECQELQKRSQSYAEIAAKQDVRTQQAAEDLIQARELADGLRGENANLKAEKDLWKRIEARLTEDNRSLSEERTRLNTLMMNNQKLSNERETVDSEQRRRLQTQVESLEADLKNLRQKLEDEVESGKNVSMRREYDQEQNRTRIDDLMRALNSTKEQLTEAKTLRDQLQARVEELKIELRTAQEHAQALQPRPTPRAPTAGQASNDNDDSGLSREQELSIEVADLRRELDLKKGELENVKEQVQQYMNISQSSEDALHELEETYNEFREDAEKVAAEKDDKLKELEQRRDDIAHELSVTNQQYTELQTRANGHQRELDNIKAEYDSQIVQVRDDCDRYKETAALRQEDLKAQADIAQRAQQSYENELVKHAEAAKNLQDARNQLNSVKLEISSAKAEAETAKAQLTQSEESWSSTREQFENEVSELKHRRDDIAKQNQVLHEQLSSVTSQISKLGEKRKSMETAGGQSEPAEPDSIRSQEIIDWLRREKEIVDIQYELLMQETQRLKHERSKAEEQLNDARLRLEEERQRQQGQQSYSKLADTINELNVYRESTVTLRSEARRAQAQLEVKSKKVDDLQAQIEPLRTTVRELENRQETAQGEMKLLQEDRDKWQKRTQDILSKYDRVDPAELQELKDQLGQLKQEHEQATTEKQALQTQVDSFPTELERATNEASETAKQELLARLTTQFKGRAKELNSKISELTSQLKELNADKQRLSDELDQSKTDLASVQKDLQATQQQRDEAQAAADSAQATQTQQDNSRGTQEDGEVQDDSQEQLQAAQQHSQELSARAEALQSQVDQLQAAVQERDSQIQELQGRLAQPSSQDTAEGDVADDTTKVQELQSQISQLSQTIASYESQIQELQQRLSIEQAAPQEPNNQNVQNQSQADAEPNEHIAKLREDLAAAQQELEALRQSSAAPTSEQTTTAQKSDAPGQEAAIRIEIEQQYIKNVQSLEAYYNDRVKTLRVSLQEKLNASKEKAKAAIRTQEAAKVQAEHETALSNLKLEHEQELSRVRNEQQTKISELESKVANGSQGASTDLDVSSSTAVKDFVSRNPTVKEMIGRNVRDKVAAEKDAIARKFQEDLVEREEALRKEMRTEVPPEDRSEEVEKRIEAARDEATKMAEKKSQLKLNMAKKRQDDAQAKVDVVQRAATETPQKPVAEVWNVAKDAKPQLPQPVSIQTPGAAAAAAARPATPASQPARPSSGAPTANNLPTPHTAQPQAPAAPMTTTTNLTNGAPVQTHPVPATPAASQEKRQAPTPAQQPNAAAAEIPKRPMSRPPSRGGTSQPNPPNQSGIPKPGQSFLPRGGGNIRGRGGRGGGMNPQAGQFQPGGAGVKRPAEDAGAGRGDGGKRARGGAQS